MFWHGYYCSVELGISKQSEEEQNDIVCRVNMILN